jgi:DNA polymerase
MRRVVLANETDWDGWRKATRSMVLANVPPDEVRWSVRSHDEEGDPLREEQGSFGVSKALVSLASLAIQAREPGRFGLLYRLVWRANAGERVLEKATDADAGHARGLAFAVRAEAHRMRTQIRYLPIEDNGGTRFLGWYEPAHYVVEANAQLIARRFPDHAFSILTPDGGTHWDGRELRFSAGVARSAVHDDAALRSWWHAHHAGLLRRARIGTSVPPAEELDEAPRPPDRPALGAVVLPLAPDAPLQDAMHEASDCRRCPLWEPATQTVFGEGPAHARVVFVGEQPGDQEDVIGRPFVGPAGQIMDRAMEEAGLDRRTVYITNAVKHFKFEPRGRIHKTPEAPEIRACRFWLDVELVRLQPKLVVAMGGTAARAVLGRAVTITRERGRPIELGNGQTAFVTVHPSFLLRLPDEDAKAREYRAFVADLRKVLELVG